jgi:transposase, IS30 family
MKKYTHYTKAERLELSILLRKGYSKREIGISLVRSHSSIVREVKKNSTNGEYDPHKAQLKYKAKRRFSKYQGMKIVGCTELESYVKKSLQRGRTPEQIAGRLKEVDKHLPYVSRQGIYKWLYSAYGQSYCQYLPSKQYRKKRRKSKKTKREMIPNRVSIHKRPLAANERLEFGHFEADTVVSGKKYGSVSLNVVVERKSRFVKLKKLSNLKPSTTNRALKRSFKSFSEIKSLTLDNGIENKWHEQLKLLTFFCDSYASWQKGAVENVNLRIRRFIPKGAPIADYTDSQIQKIEDWLNHTPRKCLNYKTPYEIMSQENLLIKHPSGALQG